MGTTSHPVWGAWIEILRLDMRTPALMVAPRVGAWIEISQVRGLNRTAQVAPRVGAWIEILAAAVKRQ